MHLKQSLDSLIFNFSSWPWSNMMKEFWLIENLVRVKAVNQKSYNNLCFNTTTKFYDVSNCVIFYKFFFNKQRFKQRQKSSSILFKSKMIIFIHEICAKYIRVLQFKSRCNQIIFKSKFSHNSAFYSQNSPCKTDFTAWDGCASNSNQCASNLFETASSEVVSSKEKKNNPHQSY